MPYPEYHYRWEWPLASTPEALWPLVSDTNRFNREAGVPVVEDRTTTGESPPKARRRLRLKLFGVQVEWEEEPFEWVRPRAFGVVRRYLRGPMAQMRVLCELIPQPAGGTLLVYEVWARPRNPIGLLGIPFQIGVLSARQFGAAFRKFDKLASLPQAAPDLLPAVALAPGGRARLDAARRRLADHQLAPELVARLVETIAQADDLALVHLRPYVLADRWGVSRRAVLELCLWATREGLLNLQWDLLCPLCRGAKETAGTLSRINNQVHCDVCQINFSVNFESSVELTFRPNPMLREIELRPFCIGGPQVTPHIVAQQLMTAGSRRTLSLPLEAGRYRLRALGVTGNQTLLVTPEGAAEATFSVGGNGSPSPEMQLAVRPTLHLENASGAEQLLILERTLWSDQSVTAAEVITLQTFRDLFASEALRPGEQISVGSLTILFTDLRDSTRLYSVIGDAPAFGRVMDHFDILRAAIDAAGGAIVKTIGDSVMAAFRRPLGGLQAMLRAQQALAALPEAEHPLVLKVGIHHGPCIAVTLNERLDYFGSTVNIAARIQNLAIGDDIVISSAIRNDPEVDAWLADPANRLRAEPFQAQLKGFEGLKDLWRIVHTLHP